ncbi:MAG: hypothetical protein J6T10_17145 [Methanobrevibacter sp.]|nr:hypothetical protein [Methanobrevibacter sp.]
MDQRFMFNTLEIVEDKKHNTFMVQCKVQSLAETMFRKIADLWELAMECYSEIGTYAYDLTHAGDLLANVPCNGTLMLWFDINMDSNHDKNYGIILDFIKRCTAEGLGSDMLSLETMITSKQVN